MVRLALCSLLFVLTAAGIAPGQDLSSQPATRAAPSTVERLNEQLSILEDARNPAETRRTIARNLLLDNWPETPARVTALLGGTNPGAKLAVVSALTELPQYLHPSYVDPLIAMLGDTDAEVRQAAAAALAAARDPGVIPRLRDRALQREQATSVRLGALAALGQMIDRAAIDALAEVLRDPDAAVASAALDGLQRAAAIDLADVDAAVAWWEATRGLSDETWHREQIERLVRRDRDTRTRLNAVETRLMKVLETNFQRATDAERAAQIGEFLSDPSPNLRLLGLALVRKHLGDGKPLDSLPRELVSRVRDLLGSRSPAEQAAAVRTVASFRRSEDASLLIDLLATARDRDVRLAVVNGLGYVGDDRCIRALLDALPLADTEVATEIYAAFGRIAERSALSEGSRPAVVEALEAAFERSAGGPVAMRERVLWAMGNVADPRFASAFAAGLDRNEAIAVRQQAVRGISILKEPKLADALAAAATDSDVVVRGTAVESLATLGSSDRHLQALMGRVSSPPETDEGIRQSAWRGALAILVTRPQAEIDDWLGRLPGDDRQRAQRTSEVLQRLVRNIESERVGAGPRLGLTRARLAGTLAELGQTADAVAAYTRALPELEAADTATRVKVASDLLRISLVGGLYNASVAETLGRVSLESDPDAYWRTARSEIELRLAAGDVSSSRLIIKMLNDFPPGQWSAAARDGLAGLAARAAQEPTSQPGNNSTSRPADDGASASSAGRP